MKHRINKLKFWENFSFARFTIRRDHGSIQSTLASTFALRLFGFFLLALLLAFLLCMLLDGFLAGKTMQIQTLLAQSISQRSPSVFSAVATVPKSDITFSAFNVAEKAPVLEVVEEEKKEATPIDLFRLVGTIPPVAAWVTVESATSLVLKDQEFNGYILSQVDSGSVVFSLDGDNYTIYLNYSAKQPVPSARPKQTASAPPAATPSAQGANVQNAEFNGQDGTISRELLHSLLMNPYAELGKLRLIPTSSGMIVKMMRPDSLLHQLGVKAEDELTGINGISIKDVPSIMNAINSMMTGARLDFDVVRGSERGKLGYVVK
ncbi:hypothetical protein LJC31_01460 [Synergistaceae bacterium OttesenSCG-928-I11]|nr:hypothetical protein [Synergistaceae bacterium OttesenSCG-928-I11]